MYTPIDAKTRSRLTKKNILWKEEYNLCKYFTKWGGQRCTDDISIGQCFVQWGLWQSQRDCIHLRNLDIDPNPGYTLLKDQHVLYRKTYKYSLNVTSNHLTCGRLYFWCWSLYGGPITGSVENHLWNNKYWTARVIAIPANTDNRITSSMIRRFLSYRQLHKAALLCMPADFDSSLFVNISHPEVYMNEIVISYQNYPQSFSNRTKLISIATYSELFTFMTVWCMRR